MLKHKYFAIFGGGGIRGISYCGAYKALQENNIDLTGCAGSSIGAVFASLISVGYNYDEIYEIVGNIGVGLLKDINIDLKKEVGFSKGNIFLEWMREVIEKKYYGENYEKNKMRPVLFSDIKSNLIIYSVDLTNLKFKEFSKEKTPDYEIARAVRASVSMPGLFTPMEEDNKLFVDGDLLKSTPLWRVTNSIKNLDERILEFRLEDNIATKQIQNSFDYINRVYNAICGFATDYIIDLYNEKDKFDYIKINTPGVSVVDFLIPKEKRQELFNTGYEVTKEYLSEILPEKRIKNKEKYQKLLKTLLKIQKELDKDKVFEAYYTLCEIFMHAFDEKKYIDSRVSEMLSKFKKLFLENYNVVNFLGIKKASIENKEEISKYLLDIIKFITLKDEEL